MVGYAMVVAILSVVACFPRVEAQANNETSGEAVTTHSPTESEGRTTPIYIAGLFPLSNHWWVSYSTTFAIIIQEAFDEIATTTDILSGYHLQLLRKDTEGQTGLAIKRLVEFIQEPPTKVMLMGPALSNVAAAVAQAVQHWNLYQVVFSTRSSVFSDRKRYPNIYQVNFANRELNPVKVALMKQFGWTRCATLTTDSEVYVSAMNDLHDNLAENNVTLVTSGVIQGGAISTHVRRLKQYEIRIIFAAVGTSDLVPIFCEAYQLGMYGKHHVWILDAFRAGEGWPEKYDHYLTESCTVEQVRIASAGSFVIDQPYTRRDGQRSISGKTTQEFDEWVDNIQLADGLKWSRNHPWTYDAAWTVALVLNKTMAELPPNVSIFDFNYDNSDTELMSALGRNLQDLEFEGVSGPVFFTKDGSRRGISYIQRDPEMGPRVQVGSYDPRTDEISWDMPLVWEGGEPPKDHFEHRRVKKGTNQAAFLVFGLAAAAGLVLAGCFLVFNIIFRKKRVIKMSSPNINNMIILGTMSAYMSVFLYGLGPDDTSFNVCMGKVWLSSLGYTVGFGAMFSKTWRVHAIFKNKTLRTKIVKDVQLVGMVLVLIAIDLLLLVPWTVWTPQQWQTREEVETTDDVVYTYEYSTCYHDNQYYWFGALYVYKGLLLVFGVFLAWETRMISIPALNDSKYIGFAVYNVVVACVFGVPISHVLGYNQVDLRFCVVALMMVFCTTAALCLVFVPKVVLALRPDADDKIVFSSTTGGASTIRTRHHGGSTVAPTSDARMFSSVQSDCDTVDRPHLGRMAVDPPIDVANLQQQLTSEKRATEHLCQELRRRFKSVEIMREGDIYRINWNQENQQNTTQHM